jgi:hypothetical protein
MTGTVFIHDFVQVPRPFAEVSAAILADGATLFGAPAAAAYGEGERLSVRLSPSLKHPGFGKRVKVDIGRAYECHDRLVVPIHWWASGATALFPRLEADLEVAPLGDEATQLTLMGGYDPPLAGFGRQADRLLLHRVAEASVRSFLTRVAASLAPAPPALVSG